MYSTQWTMSKEACESVGYKRTCTVFWSPFAFLLMFCFASMNRPDYYFAPPFRTTDKMIDNQVDGMLTMLIVQVESMPPTDRFSKTVPPTPCPNQGTYFHPQ